MRKGSRSATAAGPRQKEVIVQAMDATVPLDRRIRIALLAQRCARPALLLGGALKKAGAGAEIKAYDGEECDILAAFDTRLPVRRITLPEHCVPVIYSGSSRVRRALADCTLPCVSCGTAAYDTVTVSSLSRGHAMLTVQRELETLDGGIIEPCELPVRYSGCDIHKALVCAAVVLVCAGVPPEGSIVLSPGG